MALRTLSLLAITILNIQNAIAVSKIPSSNKNDTGFIIEHSKNSSLL